MKQLSFVLFCLTLIVGAQATRPLSSFLTSDFQSIVASTQLVSPPLLSPKRKDPNRAFMQSLILPGMGQIYTESNRGYAWLGAEVAFLIGYVVVSRQARQFKSDYVQGVKDGVAFFDGPTKFDQWNMEDFEHATMYDNWRNVYNESGGEPSHPRIGKWYWKDRKEFKKTDRKDQADSPQRIVALQARQDSNITYEKARTVLGLIILNHVASAIDARILAKVFNRNRQVSHRLNIELLPQFIATSSQVKIKKHLVFRF